MNAERVAPDRIASRNGEYPINGRRQGWSTVPPSTLPASMVPPMTPSMEIPPSEVPLQEDVYSLLRERADLHAQVFDAAQIQRKLSGRSEEHTSELQSPC